VAVAEEHGLAAELFLADLVAEDKVLVETIRANLLLELTDLVAVAVETTTLETLNLADLELLLFDIRRNYEMAHHSRYF
jgi:hypothetical protein